jgi:hypothetical protein
MPLQNRVTPFGTIITTPERGSFTGNRGVIHNHQKQIIKHHAVKYWITCVLEYKGKRRELMTRRSNRLCRRPPPLRILQTSGF